MKTFKAGLTRRQLIVNAVRAGAGLLAVKGFYNTTSYNIRLERTEVRINGLPAPFRGLRMALITDIHSSAIVSAGLIGEAARLAMSGTPDVIFLGGDFISGETKFLDSSIGSFDPAYLDKCLQGLASLTAPMGIFAVTGNHDHWAGPRALEAITAGFKKSLGVRWLRNASVVLRKGGRGVELIGIDDYWSGGSVVAALGSRADRGLRRILLSHNPDVNEEIGMSGARVDLVLSGHTHGGQVRLPLAGAPFIPSNFGDRYLSGLVSDGPRQTYVSRGVGNLLFPFRLLSPPEVSLITLV